jgi:hypothetical protein
MLKTTHRQPAHRRRAQRGVSLLETVSVVTIASSLSAVAIPKLTHLPGEARVSVVRIMEGALHSASALMHMQCAVDASCHLQTGTATLWAEGDQVRMARGYPRGGHPQGIANALQFTGFTAKHSGRSTVFTKDGADDSARCAVVYEAPGADGQAPTITALTSGC